MAPRFEVEAVASRPPFGLQTASVTGPRWPRVSTVQLRTPEIGDGRPASASPMLDLLHLSPEIPVITRDQVERAKRPSRLPVVLTKEEVHKLFQHLHGTHRLMAGLLYGHVKASLTCH